MRKGGTNSDFRSPFYFLLKNKKQNSKGCNSTSIWVGATVQGKETTEGIEGGRKLADAQ